MSKMNLPGFTAEASLYRTSNQYQQATAGRTGTAFVMPSAIAGGIISTLSCYGGCFWDYIKCLGSGGPLPRDPYCGLFFQLCIGICQLTTGPIFSQ